MILAQTLGVPHFDGTVIADRNKLTRKSVVSDFNDVVLMAAHDHFESRRIEFQLRQGAVGAEHGNFSALSVDIAGFDFLIYGDFADKSLEIGRPNLEAACFARCKDELGCVENASDLAVMELKNLFNLAGMHIDHIDKATRGCDIKSVQL